MVTLCGFCCRSSFSSSRRRVRHRHVCPLIFMCRDAFRSKTSDDPNFRMSLCRNIKSVHRLLLQTTRITLANQHKQQSIDFQSSWPNSDLSLCWTEINQSIQIWSFPSLPLVHKLSVKFCVRVFELPSLWPVVRQNLLSDHSVIDSIGNPIWKQLIGLQIDSVSVICSWFWRLNLWPVFIRSMSSLILFLIFTSINQFIRSIESILIQFDRFPWFCLRFGAKFCAHALSS